MARSYPGVSADAVRRLWFQRQGLTEPRGTHRLTKKRLVDHLERTGGLQLDSVNVIDRAHYLTLWSRFGEYDRSKVDRWVYRERAGFEYWSHEASILPMTHLPLARRRMRRFPAHWEGRSWYAEWKTSPTSRRRVLRRLRHEGPLETMAFEGTSDDTENIGGWAAPLAREDKRSLRMLWHGGQVAVDTRRHFRRVYDLADRVYPSSEVVSRAAWEDSWLLVGLSGNGVASEAQLVHYISSTALKAPDRRRVLERNLRAKRVVEVRVEGSAERHYALPEHLELAEGLGRDDDPVGTTLLCPFDSFLWQRRRAEELLDFSYRLEIYVPPAKRVHGYYVLPILHDGRLVGRLDPKLHREEGVLEVRNLSLEPGFDGGPRFVAGLAEALESLAAFLGAQTLKVPRGWRGKLG